MRKPDTDDRPSPTYSLRNPWRLSTLAVKGAAPIELEEFHAFLWLTLKYQEANRGRMKTESADKLRFHSMRLLKEWLEAAEFEKGAVH